MKTWVVGAIWVLGSVWAAFGGAAFGQVSQGGTPPSYTLDVEQALAIPTYALEAPSAEDLAAEDAENAMLGRIPTIGRVLPLEVDLVQDGSASPLPDGRVLFRLEVRVDGAEGLGLYFQAFDLPETGELFVYTPDYSQVLGAFTAANNKTSGQFVVQPLESEVLRLEYAVDPSQAAIGQITLQGLGFMYRNFARNRSGKQRKDFGNSQSCQVNANCAEGANWNDPKRAVARILVRVGPLLGWCTGTLVNNTAQDNTPYFLTAEHCALRAVTSQGITDQSDLDQWLFYFNYRSASCSNPLEEGNLGNQTVAGGTLRANSDDEGGETGSDLLLLELQEDPDVYQPYYAGWNRSLAPAVSGVCLHHPSGDILKISTFNSTPSVTSWNGANIQSHWELAWINTSNGHGTTEGGSSGSALLNSNGQVIGTLTGGASGCDALTASDYYGTVAYHWASNGSSAARQLGPWLDPSNTGQFSLNGRNYNATVSQAEALFGSTDLKLFPNPTSGQLRIGLARAIQQYGQLQLVDTQGRVVWRQSVQAGTQVLETQLQDLPAGLYVMHLQADGQRASARVLMR